jgi:hypothetical protein
MCAIFLASEIAHAAKIGSIPITGPFPLDCFNCIRCQAVVAVQNENNVTLDIRMSCIQSGMLSAVFLFVVFPLKRKILLL